MLPNAGAWATRSGAAQFRSTTFANQFVVSATDTLVYTAGNGFAEIVGTSDLALTAAGCRVTYTGPTSLWVVTFYASFFPSVAPGAQSFPWLGIDVSGDLVGASVTTTPPPPYSIDGTFNGSDVVALNIGRVVTLTSGATIQPVMAAIVGAGTPTGVEIGINTFNALFVPLGLV